MSNKAFITIIIATFNSQKTLVRCLDSILKQAYSQWEIIIMDGNSTDETTNILKSYDESITLWRSEPDKGIYDAWNKALRYVTGDWLLFLGADDYLWSPDVLANVAKHLTTLTSNQRIAYGSVNVVSEENKLIRAWGEPWHKAKKGFFIDMSIPHQGTFHHRSLLEPNGFNPTFRIAGDYHLLIRELKKQDAYFIPNVIVSGMQTGGISNAPKYRLLAIWENAQAKFKNGLLFYGVLTLIMHLYLFLKARIKLLLIKVLGVKRVKTLIRTYKQVVRKPT